MNSDPANQQEKFVLGTWDIVAVVGYFVVILGVGMMVCIYYFNKNKYENFNGQYYFKIFPVVIDTFITIAVDATEQP